MTDFAALIRERSSPLEAKPTGMEPRLEALDRVRAVLFDVYGTLVISGSGDVGTASPEGKAAAFGESLRAAGYDWPADRDGAEGVEALVARIKAHHEHLRGEGVRYPEVRIQRIWRETLMAVGVSENLAQETARIERLAVEYELRTNPTWAMPYAAETLRDLKSRGFVLGIVSNAQSFTRDLFPAHLGDTVKGFGFDGQIQEWSYFRRFAKPGTELYEAAANSLRTRHGIAPSEVLYVGNDLLNDCTPAQQVGFRTALFAGDARSLRLREGDDRVAETRPTIVVTDLRQLLDCLPRVETVAVGG
ncbi:MAG: HAD family hydrolase [Planctomycetota bacterium]